MLNEFDSYNVLSNTLKNNEYMFISYNTLIVMKEINLIEYIMKNYDKYKDKLYLDMFIDVCRPAIVRLLLERRVKDVIDWLIRDPKDSEDLHNELYDYINYTSEDAIFTDFSTGLVKLLCSHSVEKIVISMDYNDVCGLKLLNELFYEYVDDKIFIVDMEQSTIVKYIKDKNFTLIMTDEIDILANCLELLEGKSVCIPFTGYNFEKRKDELMIDDMELLLSKHEFEIKSYQYKFNLGFIEPFKMKPEMFQMG